MEKSWLTWVLAAALVVSLFFNFSDGKLPESSNKDYPFLAKRIFNSQPNDILINFTELRTKLRDYVNNQKERIGIYFEYLPTGVSVGVNDRQDFFRTDLVQLPVVMRAYRLINEGKLKPDKELLDEGQPSGISVAEAIQAILHTSDRQAFFLLADEINGKEPINLSTSEGNESIIRELYDYLDIPVARSGETQFISPKSYASILKSLYFSAYLDYPTSSDILKKLADSSFNDWLPDPIPGGIKVAHKYGYHESGDVQVVKVYSDCGIFYLTERPYLLCVMVNSGDREKSIRHIRSISKEVYDYVAE